MEDCARRLVSKKLNSCPKSNNFLGLRIEISQNQKNKNSFLWDFISEGKFFFFLVLACPGWVIGLLYLTYLTYLTNSTLLYE